MCMKLPIIATGSCKYEGHRQNPLAKFMLRIHPLKHNGASKMPQQIGCTKQSHPT
jgi:hypothetical protein